MFEAAHEALRCLLEAVGHQAEALDQEIIGYIISTLDDPDPESCVEVLLEVIGSAVPSFSDLSNEKQLALVLQLLEQGRTSEAQQAMPSASANAVNNLDTVLKAFKKATLLSSQPACTDVINTVAISSEACGSGSYQAKGPDIIGLIEFCPTDISQEFLSYLVQQKFGGDLQAAADYLFECSDMKSQQSNWLHELELQEQLRKEVELQKKYTKKQIVDRFDLQAVPEMRKANYGAALLPPLRKAEQQTKVRYRDGQIVSSKGEKYIVEKVGNEWDGGSRGKVYTKGKRGKGFT